MWSYYGSKSLIVDLYPHPKHNLIIEPFAGSARYALKYFQNDVILVDKYDIVIKCWHYLQSASVSDILGLPKLDPGDDLSQMNLSEGEKIFLGFFNAASSISPRNKPSPFAIIKNGRKNQFKRVADQLYKIRHWKIIEGDYMDIDNQKATWFIDPPYQKAGHAYKHNIIDFHLLSRWVNNREGQTIVCENMGADWLPFVPLTSMRGSNGKHAIEAIWSNEPTAYDMQQAKLF